MILVDANVIIALATPHDQLNGVAIEDWSQLDDQPFVVTEPVLAEAVFAVRSPHARANLARLFESLHALTPTIADSWAIRRDIFAWITRYAEHEPDWADAHLAVLCGRDKRYRVWTYDQEFRSIWRRPDGTRIPVVGRDPRRL